MEIGRNLQRQWLFFCPFGLARELFVVESFSVVHRLALRICLCIEAPRT